MKIKKILFITLLSINIVTYAQWIEQNTAFGVASRGVQYISIVDSNTVWISTLDSSGATNPDFVRDVSTTSDGGQNWIVSTVNANSGLRIGHVHGVSSQVAYAVLFPGSAGIHGAGIYQTTNGGATWIKQNSALYSDSDSFPNVVHFFDANNGVCQGDPTNGYFEIYTTTDGGLNWNRVPQANIPAPLSNEVGYTSQIFSAGTRVWFTTNKGRIFRSDDQGMNWDVFQSPISDFGGDTMSGEISFWDNNNGVLINNNGGLLRTTDGAETWNPINVASGYVWGNDISCVPGTSSVIVSSGGSHTVGSADRGSSYSLDGGLNWIDISLNNQIEVSFYNSTTGWAGGFTSSDTPPTGGIFKYTGTELTAAVGSNELSITNAYPNPVKDIFTIEGVDIISNVSVFNMLGQEVLTTQPNVLTAKIDMSNLTSGSYVVKATVNGNTQTIKLIK